MEICVMKNAFMAVLFLIFLSGLCSAEEKLKQEDEKFRRSYSAGYQVGGDLMRQGTAVKPDALLKGIQDAMSGAAPLMTQEEMRTALMNLQKKVLKKQEQKEQTGQSPDEGVKQFKQ
jgi:FKBP-type peptidyl-prolyl cis-trans isomerase FklB